MKLLPKDLEKTLPKLGATDESISGQSLADRKVFAKFFTPDSNWTWYVLEGERQGHDDVLFFGLVCGFEKELGYFGLAELESVRGPMGLPIERDLYLGDKTLGQLEPAFCTRAA